MVGGPCDFSVSPRSKSFFFSFFGGLLFDLGACWDKDLDQGLTIKCSPEYVIYVFKNIFKIFVSIGFACFTGWL